MSILSPTVTPARCAAWKTRRITNLAAHPLVLQISDLIDGAGIGRRDAAKRADLCRSTVRDWLVKGARPALPALDSLLNSLGYRLAAVRVGEPLPELVGTARQGGRERYVNPETHPMVRAMIDVAHEVNASIAKAAAAAGVRHTTVKAWWSALGNQPALATIEPMLLVFGFELRIVPLEQRYRA